MKRIANITIGIISALILTITAAQAQVSVQVGGGIGVLSPTADLRGTTLDYYAGQKYGLGSGLALAGKVRLGILGFNLVGEVGYASLSNDGNSEPGQGFVEVSQKILTFRAGPEFHIALPAIPLTPYVGGSIALHRFSGETTFRGVSKVPSATFSVETATRFGVGINGGAILDLGPALSLDFGIGYSFMNIGGKDWTDPNPTQDQRLDSYLALNDGKDPLYRVGDDKHFVNDERSISSVQFMVSLMFGI